MTLTGQGYVALGQAAGTTAKFNHNHDEQGRFATAGGTAGAAAHQAKPREQIAQGDIPEEDENRDTEEPTDPLAEVRQQDWANARQTLRALDPKNPKLDAVTPDGWVPTDAAIADINAEIVRVAIKRVTDYLRPDGKLIGTRLGNSEIINLPGGARAAQAAFDYLKVGGTPYKSDYPGDMITLPGGIGTVGFRYNDQNLPTLDVKVPGIIRQMRFHYQGD